MKMRIDGSFCRVFFAVLVFCLLGLSTAQLQAQKFELTNRPLAIPESGTITSTVLKYDTNEFLYVPPYEWRLVAKPQEKEVSYLSPDSSVGITIKVVPGTVGKMSELKSETLRGQIAQRFPKAKINEEFPVYGIGMQGLAFELATAASNGANMNVRLAFLPILGGVVEFTMVAPADKYKEYLMSFSNVVGSFRPLSPAVEK